MRMERSHRPVVTALGLALVVAFESAAAQAGATRATDPRLTFQPKQPGPGSLIRVTIDRLAGNGDSVVSVAGDMANEPLHFLESAGGSRVALAAIPIDASDSVVARVLVGYASGAIDTVHSSLRFPHHPPPLAVARTGGRMRGASRLRVDARFTRPMADSTAARIEQENALARDVGRRAHDTPKLWTYPFLRPRASRVTSRFGSGRVFNGRVSSSHLGIDYRGALGEPIRAANRGVVALVAAFYLAGNVVYIDHGAGLVTGYFHMSQPEVSAGDTVERGQEIGLVGATGRVTGPHLHWSARFGDLTIDPADLLSLGAPFTAPDTTPEKRTLIRIKKPR